MKPLEEMLLMQKALRQRRTPSVMNQQSAPAWQPEYEKEPPLEQVSPEDFIPNPKTALAALKGIGPAIGMLGQTVWHGSPHKFNKFDMSKIGTGEGAQAYGHGLYTAESRPVGEEYARALSKNAAFDGKPVYEIDTSTRGRNATEVRGKFMSRRDAQGQIPSSYSPQGLDMDYPGPIAAMKALVKSGLVPKKSTKWLDPNTGHINVSSVEPQLYKVDIPDEAIAKFLDWDKPLSEQAPGVFDRLKQSPSVMAYMAKEEETRNRLNASHPLRLEKLKSASVPYDETRMTGKEAWTALAGEYENQGHVSDRLRELGVPGIRYLDGSSRTAGDGTSNFVLFDDKLPRILERNGEATGLQPWKPGEWQNDSMANVPDIIEALRNKK